MNNNNYSYLVQALHHLVLGNRFIPELLHDIEKLIYKKKIKDISKNNHMFINGLARSGSTILMRSIFETKEFSALTYRDMPFVICPNIWNKVSKKFKKQKPIERQHKDNILIDLDSPEQLEEAFWKLKTGKEYIRYNELKSYSVNKEVMEDYKAFINLVLIKYKKENYLTKNNNNILRLSSIRDNFPNSLILIPFRDPINQSYSLLNQHILFSKIQKKNKFTKKYMAFLAHHEFGLIQKPFLFDDDADKKFFFNKDDVNYWLQQWIYVYKNLSRKEFIDSNNIIFICYEEIINNPSELFNKIFDKTKNSIFKRLNFKTFKPKKRDQEQLNLDKNLKEEAKNIYQSLKKSY